MASAVHPSVTVAGSGGGATTQLSTVTIVILVLVTAGGLAGGGGGLFPIIFVASAVVAALVAYYRQPARYVTLVFALWFFTPWVRRVVDYHHGFRPANVILVAPTLVTAVSVLTLIYRARELRGTMLYPFSFTLAGVVYGYAVGMLKVGSFPATYAMLTWVGPVSFSMHLILNWRLYPQLREAFLSFLQWALPLTAAYGIYQFVSPPTWDVFWMRAAEVYSIGAPVPFGFRAFGTMNSPGPYAAALLIGMLILLGSTRRGSTITLSLGLVALLLTRVRASWVALLVGLFIVMFMGPIRRMARNGLILLLMFGLALPVLSIDTFRDTITKRIASFASLSEDSSVQQRLVLSNLATQAVGARAEGEGLGATGGGTKLAAASGRQASIDNGFLEVFFVLGWPGGSLIMLGLMGQLLTLFRFRDARWDSFANSTRACIMAMLAVLLIGDIFSGANGALFWGCYGFACSAHAYNYSLGVGLRSRQLAREFTARQPAPVPT